MLLLGGGYNLALWGVGQVLFPAQAEGSLIRRSDGSIAGSRLIAQQFTQPQYFQPRPSGVDYNAASTGGTNFGPSNPDHLKAVKERLDEVVAREGVAAAGGAIRDDHREWRRHGPAHPAGGGRAAGGAGGQGPQPAARARAHADRRAHGIAVARRVRPGPRQRARTQPGARRTF